MYRTDVDLEEAYEAVRALKVATGEQEYKMRILSVGNTQPLNVATHVIHTNKLTERLKGARYKKIDDLSESWGYKKSFDFIFCIDVLQEERDPISIINQMSKLGNKGFIRVIDRSFESLKNIESEEYAGFANHRWFVEEIPKKLKFTYKHPHIHFIKEYQVEMSGVKYLNIWWENSIKAFEHKLFSEEDIKKYFMEYNEIKL